MGANPNIFIDKENRRIVPPEEENFFVSAEEFKAIDTAFASKADQSDLNGLDSRVDTLETDLGTAETDIGNLELGKLDASALVTDFDSPNDVTVPSTLAVETKIDAEIEEQVPLYNTDQFGEDIELKTEIKGLRRVKTGTSITFKNPISTYGTLDAPVTTMTISDLTGAIPFNKSYVFIQSLTVPTIIEDEIANGGLTTIIPTGTFNITSNAINIVELEYINDSYVNAKIQSIIVGDPIDESIFLLLNYDENKDLSIDNTLINSSLYSEDVEPYVLNGGDASYTLVSGDDYDLETGGNAVASARARHEASVSISAKTDFELGTGITIIRGFKKSVGGEGFSIASNNNSDGTTGVRFAMSSGGVITVRINAINATIASGFNNTDFFWFATTFDGTTTKVYRKSIGFSFSEILSSTAHTGEDIDFAGASGFWWFERSNSSGSTTPASFTNRKVLIANRAMSSAEIDALMI